MINDCLDRGLTNTVGERDLSCAVRKNEKTLAQGRINKQAESDHCEKQKNAVRRGFSEKLEGRGR